MPTPTKQRSPSRRSDKSRASIFERSRTPLTWLAAVRIAVGLLAIPLAPLLYREHFLWLVLMRPTKEVLLAGGFLVRQDKVNLIELIAAAAPLAVVGVWHFFALGRAWAREIQTDKLPWIAKRVLPTNKIKELRKTLKKRGEGVVLLGRLAVFPSSVLAATAGSSKMEARRFLPVDALGALLSLIEVIGAGYLLGATYKSAGPWITVVGLVALLGMLIVLGRAMRRS